MIKITKLHIVKFRGIIDLTVDLKTNSFAVCGPNGTGKSGIVDAIEFALSGEISRLSGKNRGAVSVKKHSPHVDFRDRPGESFVKLSGKITKTGEDFSITRSVEGIADPLIEPSTQTVKEILAELGRHRNSTLSRRELIEYVLSTPGNRAEQIQALLQLDFLRDTRQTLQKIARARETVRKTLEQERKDASNDLSTALGIPTLKADELLKQVNIRREKLGLPSIAKLEIHTSVKDGLSVVSERHKQSVSKTVVKADLAAARRVVQEFASPNTVKNHEDLDKRVKDLQATGEFEKGVDRQLLLNRALELIEEDKCPVCDTAWKPEDLTSLIREKLSKLESFLKEKKALIGELEPLALEIDALRRSAQKTAEIAKSIDPSTDVSEIEAVIERLEASVLTLKNPSDLESLSTTIQSSHSSDTILNSKIERTLETVEALPDTSERDAARDFLVEIDVRLGAYRESSRKEKKAEGEAHIAKTIFECFKGSYETGLNSVYSEIQDRFAELYREINKEDEAGFEAAMPIQAAGVGLDVDFYGRGKFPPGAYHSEGHQDGMGLCLYLALMDHLYGEDFDFCVLDDVLMSVDSSHRRAVCSMFVQRGYSPDIAALRPALRRRGFQIAMKQVSSALSAALLSVRVSAILR